MFLLFFTLLYFVNYLNSIFTFVFNTSSTFLVQFTFCTLKKKNINVLSLFKFDHQQLTQVPNI